MSVPNHHPGCSTTMWNTRCPDCRKPVYFFSCSCGSRLFFDVPGAPWTPHEDRCVHYMARRLEADGWSAEEAERRLLDYAAQNCLQVPDELLTSVRERGKLERAHTVYVARLGERREIAASVMAADMRVNLFRCFNLPEDAPMSRGLLGGLGRAFHGRVRLREDEKDVRGVTAEFTALIRTELLKEEGLRQGHRVIAVLDVHAVPGRDPVWVVSDLFVRR